MVTALANAVVSDEVLSGIASGLAATADPHQLPPGTAGRRYVRLLQTPAYDAWLIEWAPGSDLDLHDHGGSASAYQVVAGVLLEQSASLSRRRPVGIFASGPGHVRLVRPDVAHRIWNPGPLPALTVHVYSPPLTSMTYYSTEPETFLEPLDTRPVSSGTLEPALV